MEANVHAVSMSYRLGGSVMHEVTACEEAWVHVTFAGAEVAVDSIIVERCHAGRGELVKCGAFWQLLFAC